MFVRAIFVNAAPQHQLPQRSTVNCSPFFRTLILMYTFLVFNQVVQRIEEVQEVQTTPGTTTTTTSTTPRPPYVYTYDKNQVINEILSVS